MRKALMVALAAASFGLGAWLSPALTARSQVGDFPVTLQRGQRVVVLQPASSTCDIEQIATLSGQWVQCSGGYWRNLATGAAFHIEPRRR
jgi:hypothetical protein